MSRSFQIPVSSEGFECFRRYLEGFSLKRQDFLVAMRTQVKSRIHSLVDNQLFTREMLDTKPSGLFLKKGRKWLDSIDWSADDRALLDSHLRVLDILDREVATTDEIVKEISDKDSDAKLLATIPGIGVTLGTLFSIEIDGIERFSSVSKLCPYAGLVPSTHSSGGKT
jgi:transposase